CERRKSDQVSACHAVIAGNHRAGLKRHDAPPRPCLSRRSVPCTLNLYMSRAKQLQREFVRLAGKRARQLSSHFRDIVKNADPESVHIFPKTTRHLQTIVEFFKPRRHPRRVKKLRRQLQEFRHAAGEWRDSDVMLRELKRTRVKPPGGPRLLV